MAWHGMATSKLFSKQLQYYYCTTVISSLSNSCHTIAMPYSHAIAIAKANCRPPAKLKHRRTDRDT